MGRYSLVTVLTDGVVGLSSEEFGRQLWHRCSTRKVQECEMCHWKFGVGSRMYRPITNGYNRMQRLCEDCVDRLIVRMVEG